MSLTSSTDVEMTITVKDFAWERLKETVEFLGARM